MLGFGGNYAVDVVVVGQRGADVFAEVQGLWLWTKQVEIFVPVVCGSNGVAVWGGCRSICLDCLCLGVDNSKHRAQKIVGYDIKNGRSLLDGHFFDLRTELFSEVQSLDDCTIAFDVCLLKVCKKVSSVTNHFKKTAT